MRRLIIIALALIAFFLTGFLVAAHFGLAEPELWQGWMRNIRQSTGSTLLVSLVVFALLAIDLLLPIPSSVVMAGSGMLLGPVLGGVVSFLGALASACLGFWACRLGGRPAFQRFVSPAEMGRTEAWFQRYGLVAIIVSRPIPMLTEVLSCLAGLTELRFSRFLAAVILGTLPICFVYSYVGSLGEVNDPWPVVWISILIPAAGWIVARRIKQGKSD